MLSVRPRMAAQPAILPRHLASSPEVWNAFIALIASEPEEPFTAVQRVAALVFWYESEVQNGGHLQYFSNRGIEEAAECVGALEHVGAPSHAAVLRSALATIPTAADRSHVSPEEYVAMALEDPFGSFDTAFCETA